MIVRPSGTTATQPTDECMARETKVGLIVGLGLILFVGMMVSEYFVDSPEDQALSAIDSSNFNDSTSNQPPQFVPTRDSNAPIDNQVELERMAAVMLENSERRSGVPFERISSDPPPIEPPFRVMTGEGYTGQGEEQTPVAIRPYTPPTRLIGVAEDPTLAAGHQITPERIGPVSTDITPVIRVEIPEQSPVAVQPRQVIHTVAGGETLSEIARKHYDGDWNMWRSIRDANPGKVGVNGEVVEGAKLVIPKRSEKTTDPVADLTGSSSAGETPRPTKRKVRIIEVKEGQTLSEIAAEHLGASGQWPRIMQVNTDQLEKPEQLRAGMKLRIPADDEAQVIDQANGALAQGNGNTPEQTPRESAGQTYTVKAGDSLSKIAGEKLGDKGRFNEIFEANRDQLKSQDDIKVGMKLRLPAR